MAESGFDPLGSGSVPEYLHGPGVISDFRRKERRDRDMLTATMVGYFAALFVASGPLDALLSGDRSVWPWFAVTAGIAAALGVAAFWQAWNTSRGYPREVPDPSERRRGYVRMLAALLLLLGVNWFYLTQVPARSGTWWLEIFGMVLLAGFAVYCGVALSVAKPHGGSNLNIGAG